MEIKSPNLLNHPKKKKKLSADTNKKIVLRVKKKIRIEFAKCVTLLLLLRLKSQHKAFVMVAKIDQARCSLGSF
jgi:hypothetical protein